MRRNDLELDMILRGIVMTRGEAGATIGEMRSDYYKIVAEHWPLQNYSTNQIVRYLLKIDGLVMEQLPTGLCIWYIDDLGSNISDHYDCNNNRVPSEASTSVIMQTVSDNSQQALNTSYAIARVPRKQPSPFANQPDHSNRLSDGNRKRSFSQIQITTEASPEKRPRALVARRLPLIEQNLDMHNRHNGGKDAVPPPKTTSTEKETSITAPNELTAKAASEFIAPIQQPAMPGPIGGRSGINENTCTTQSETVSSTQSIASNLFSPSIGIIGDNYMRWLISYKLFNADLTERSAKVFNFCFRGLTVRDAFHMVFDNQNHFKAKFRYILVNVGALDILMGRELVDIIADYGRLISAIEMIGLVPIITTLPNIYCNPNNLQRKYIYQMLLLFNRFLMSTYQEGGRYFIDLFMSVYEEMKTNTSIMRYYFQDAKQVFVKNQKIEIYPWSKVGCDKIIETIERFIATKLPSIAL